MHILAATDFSTRSHRALRRAGLLARDSGGELTVVHVVDNDRPDDLVALERREAVRILGEQIGAIAELSGLKARPVVVEGDPFEGVLKAAERADLIVMGSHRKKRRNVFVGTTVERVIRKGALPVLMVNAEPTRPYRTAMAALDMSAPSAKAFRAALDLGMPHGPALTVVHGFLAAAKGKMAYAAMSGDAIEHYVTAERLAASKELTTFLSESGFDVGGQPMHLEEGGPYEVICRAVNKLEPDVLIIGTHGRSGIMKALLGSVAQEILKTVDVDVLAVPPDRPPAETKARPTHGLHGPA